MRPFRAASVVLLAASLAACASPWGGASLRGEVRDGVYTHPSGLFSVWAPYSQATSRDDEREWEWLAHDEGGDEQGFAWVTFGPAFRDVSVFGVSVRPIDFHADPAPRHAMARLCEAHDDIYLGTARVVHEATLDLDGVPTLFRVEHYDAHALWKQAGEGAVSGHAVSYLQRRDGVDLFVRLDVPDCLDESNVPISAGTLVDEAWDKQRRFVRSIRLGPPGGVP